jgi:glutamate-5-semialdehyde dehydrogenase
MSDLHEEVAAAARAARDAAQTLAHAEQSAIDGTLLAMAGLLEQAAEPILAANEADQEAAERDGMSGGLLDRLRLDRTRLLDRRGGGQLRGPAQRDDRRRLAADQIPQRRRAAYRVGGAGVRCRADGSRGLTGLASCGLDPAAVRLLRTRGRQSAEALVSQGNLLPLVILRGSGESTRELAARGAAHGVRTLAHADGGAVIFLDRSADEDKAAAIIEQSLDRLGVCNRLNLLLIHQDRWESTVPGIVERLAALKPSIRASLPPHSHPIGHEWALDSDAEATVTIAPAGNAVDAAGIANAHTSGLAAAIITEDQDAARAFLAAYAGTGAFWNATPRLLDGYKMLGLPETGINIDRVPGPRGPVTFRDLYLRQYMVVPDDRLET